MRPELVVEIAVDGVQRSTRYPGGVALRFARVRRYRPDKSAAEADTIERVSEAHDGLLSPSEAQWVDQLDLMWPDVRLAIRRAFETDDGSAATMLTTRLANEAFHRRPEAFAWITEAVDRFGEQAGPERAALLGAGSYVAWTTLDVERGLALAEAALGACDPDVMPFDCLPHVGAVGALNYSNRPADAVAIAAAALDRYGTSLHPSNRVGLIAAELVSRALAGEPGVVERAEAAMATESRGACASPVGTLWFALALARVLVGDDDGAMLAWARAHALAASVRNQWLLSMCSGATTSHGSASELSLIHI